MSDDAAFADDLAELWEHRTERQKRDIALLWLRRCFDLLADVCEREDLHARARDCRELAPGPRVALDVSALALHEVADLVAQGTARARAIATLMRGVASLSMTPRTSRSIRRCARFVCACGRWRARRVVSMPRASGCGSTSSTRDAP